MRSRGHKHCRLGTQPATVGSLARRLHAVLLPARGWHRFRCLVHEHAVQLDATYWRPSRLRRFDHGELPASRNRGAFVVAIAVVAVVVAAVVEFVVAVVVTVVVAVVVVVVSRVNFESGEYEV